MSDFSDLKEISKRALQIQKIYYDFLDDPAPEKRLQLVNYYLPREAQAGKNPSTWPLMEWNGHVLESHEQIAAYISNLPRTKHQINCIDAQPLPGNQGGDSFMITISGVAVYDGEYKRYFYQRLIMAGIEKKFYIVHDYVRWTGEG